MEEELPLPVLQHILSFLDFKDVIRTSAVSKTLNDAVATLPSLNVSDNYFVPTNQDWDREAKYLKSKSIINLTGIEEKFRSMLIAVERFIKKVRKQHNLDIQKFSLQFSNQFLDLNLNPYINQCVSALDLGSKANNIKELVLEVETYYGETNYSLPGSIFTVSSLHKLELRGFKLLATKTKLNLNSLRELNLSNSCLDDELLELLIMSSPSLQILNIADCIGFDSLKILSHYELKRVTLESCVFDYQQVQKIEIKEALNLEYFSHKGGSGTTRLHNVDVAACRNLKFLELQFVYCDDKVVERLLSNLNALEEFRMSEYGWLHHDGLRRLRISSNTLRTLWLEFSGLNAEEVQLNVQVDAPRLSEFVFSASISSILSLETSSINNVKFVRCYEDDIQYDKLVKFLASLNHSKAIKLRGFTPNDLIVPKHLRDNLHPPLCNVKHLTMDLFDHHYRYIPIKMDMLDSLLWIAPRLDSLSFVDQNSKRTFRFVYEDSTDFGVVPFKSWRNNLVEIKVESCQDDAEELGLEKYFFGECNILGDRALISRSRKILGSSDHCSYLSKYWSQVIGSY